MVMSLDQFGKLFQSALDAMQVRQNVDWALDGRSGETAHRGPSAAGLNSGHCDAYFGISALLPEAIIGRHDLK
jgi:hypothetical protein